MIQQKEFDKRGEWFLRDWVIALILFSTVIVLLFIVSTDALILNDKSNFIDNNFRYKYDRFQNTTRLVQESVNVSSGESGLSFIGTANLIFSSTSSVISLVFGSISIFNSQIANIGAQIGIPTVISQIIFPAVIGIIAITIVFIVISSTARNRV